MPDDAEKNLTEEDLETKKVKDEGVVEETKTPVQPMTTDNTSPLAQPTTPGSRKK